MGPIRWATQEFEPPTTALASMELLSRLERSIQGVIRGKDEAIRPSLVALFARGHLLIEDVPGVGKTTLAQSLARPSPRRVELTFPRRGRYTQDAVRLSTKFPFGLLRKSRLLPAHDEIVVLPNVHPTADFQEILPLLAGELESFTRGHAHDLYALRDYQETDTARHVDWKASAKARQLKVREFTREDDRRVVLVFDRRLAQCDPASLARFEKAVGFAACLAWHFYEMDAQVEFVTQGFRTPVTPAGEIIYPILETLALVEPILLASEVADDLLAHLASEDRGFKVILTGVPRSSVPAGLWASSHVTLIDSLL